MKQRAALIIGASLLLLASGLLLWRLIVEHGLTKALVAHIERRSDLSAEFVTYRAYKDAAADIKTGILHFSSRDGWEHSFPIGTLKVVVERVPSQGEALQPAGAMILRARPAPEPSPIRIDEIDWHSVYNWHKSRAAFRQLQQGTTNPSAASELLDNLERVRILTHEERLGVESPNTLDPY